MATNMNTVGTVTPTVGPVIGATPAAPLAGPDVLSKPDISATDGGQNMFSGFFTGGLFRFFGTSASAPHAAGVAALQLEANPALNPTQVKNAQKATADPVGALPSSSAGAGLINAQAAIAATPPTAPTVGVSAQACSGIFEPSSALVDGQHWLAATASDFFGQSGAGTDSFKVDTKAPSVKFSKGPKKKSTSRQAKFTLSTESGARLTCKLHKGKARGCSAKANFKVKPGNHKLLVHAAGNVGKDVAFSGRSPRS